MTPEQVAAKLTKVENRQNPLDIPQKREGQICPSGALTQVAVASTTGGRVRQ